MMLCTPMWMAASICPPLTVPADQISQKITPSPVLRVVFPVSTTMRFGTSITMKLLTECAIMYLLNHIFNRSLGRHLHMHLQTPMVVFVWMLQPVVSGEVILRGYFFDVKVFNPHVPSNIWPQLSSCYRLHENAKKHVYQQRIREVEHGPLLHSACHQQGSLGYAATCMYKRLASLLSILQDNGMGWLHCSLTFLLLKSSHHVYQGARSSRGQGQRCFFIWTRDQ